jgi:hypothetical protein
VSDTLEHFRTDVGIVHNDGLKPRSARTTPRADCDLAAHLLPKPFMQSNPFERLIELYTTIAGAGAIALLVIAMAFLVIAVAVLILVLRLTKRQPSAPAPVEPNRHRQHSTAEELYGPK